MTTPAISISGPDSLVAAIPYLLGFHPQRSLVVVCADARADGLPMIMRMDLPPADAGESHIDAVCGYVVSALARQKVEAMPIVVVFADAEPPAGGSPERDLSLALAAALEAAGMPPVDALCVVGQRWWSYLCADTEECGRCGREVDESVRLEVESRFVMMGRMVHGTREEIEAELTPAAPAAVRRMRALIARTGCPVTGKRGSVPKLTPMLMARAWSALERFAADPSAADEDDRALVLVGLRQLNLRDAFLATVMLAGAREPVDALAALVPVAPRLFRAQAAASLAALRYLEGDGTRALVALDHAVADHPECSLAHLVGAALQAGMPPSVMREVFTSFDPEDLKDRKVPAA